jgi:chromate transporter
MAAVNQLVSYAEAVRFWLKLGISFGGPAGQIAIMHQELVEKRRWISEARFLHALNYCMVLPGPEAQQLATYVGWLLHRTRGGLAAGLLFILPSLLILIALSYLYVEYGGIPAVAAFFQGIKPAVVAIVALAAWRIGRRVIHNLVLLGIAIAAFLALAVFAIPFPLVVLGAAFTGWLGARIAPATFDGRTLPSPPSSAVIDDHTATPPHAAFPGADIAGAVRRIACGSPRWRRWWRSRGCCTLPKMASSSARLRW